MAHELTNGKYPHAYLQGAHVAFTFQATVGSKLAALYSANEVLRLRQALADGQKVPPLVDHLCEVAKGISGERSLKNWQEANR